MKKTLLVFSLVIALTSSVLGNQEEIISSFEAIVAKIDGFISGSPITLVTNSIGKYSPTGTISYLLKFENLKLDYDIKKTDSIIEPYTGIVTIILKVQSNAVFGDIETHEGGPNPRDYMWGFQLAEDAKKIEKFSSCIDDPTYDEAVWCSGEIRLLYSYKKNNWIFTKIETDGDTRIGSGLIRGNIERMIQNNPEWKSAISNNDNE